MNGFDMTHVTRGSDSSLYDEKCINCGGTDEVPGGWGELGKPCPAITKFVTVIGDMLIAEAGREGETDALINNLEQCPDLYVEYLGCQIEYFQAIVNHREFGFKIKLSSDGVDNANLHKIIAENLVTYMKKTLS